VGRLLTQEDAVDKQYAANNSSTDTSGCTDGYARGSASGVLTTTSTALTEPLSSGGGFVVL
jgi:hypothetical protein